jgi:hypothetical protein
MIVFPECKLSKLHTLASYLIYLVASGPTFISASNIFSFNVRASLDNLTR